MSSTLSEKLQLYTFETTLTGSGDHRTMLPYQRVIGIGKPGGETAKENVSFDSGAAHSDKLATDVVELDVTSIFSERVMSFFQTYFATRRDDALNQYNCHRFARWIRGDPDAMDAAGLSPPDWAPALLAPHSEEEGLELGQEGVIGSRKPIVGTGEAAHSVVGLGRDSSHCLGVMGVDGFLGYETYENALLNVRVNNPDLNIALYPVEEPILTSA